MPAHLRRRADDRFHHCMLRAGGAHVADAVDAAGQRDDDGALRAPVLGVEEALDVGLLGDLRVRADRAAARLCGTKPA